MESTNKALVQAILGHHQTALDLLGEPATFEASLVKAQLLLSLGKRTEAIAVLDGTQQDTPYQKFYVFKVLTKAFLQNNEPKSAVVCLSEASKLFAEAQKEMSAQEIKECEENQKLMEARAEMERANKVSVGDVKQYAFLKGSKPSVVAEVETKETQPAKPVVVQQKPKVEPHIVKKYDWYQNATHVFLTFRVVGDTQLAK
jgi:suppressor of G2 allele of SKP1